MDDNESSLPKRRAANRSINYNEKEADAELAKRIDHLEKSRRSNAQNASSKSKNGKNSNGTSQGGKNANGNGKFKYQKFLNDKSTSWNFIPSLPPSFRKASKFSNVLDFEEAMVDTTSQTLTNPDGVLLKSNDTIYMVSEPPGEPYYIGRVVEFVCKSEFRKLIDGSVGIVSKFPVKYFQVRMNWYYRSRDIQDHLSSFDPRLVYASLHQDVCPINSYRGKCTVLHKDEINDELSDETELTTRSNFFYFDQLFDRYTLRYYDVQTTEDLFKIDNKSPYLYLLNKRFRYVFVEEKYPLEQVLKKYIIGDENVAIEKDGMLWDERCGMCKEWCTPNQSLRCDDCSSAVHLYCMDPPLDRKPNKGVVWVCFSCLKRQEGTEKALMELNLEEDAEKAHFESARSNLNAAATKAIKNGISPHKQNDCFQYLGQHLICHMEDLISDNLFLPYPFKGSRVSSKYQWSGCAERQQWSPRPYQSESSNEERGGDHTEALWKLDTSRISVEQLDKYLERCKDEFPSKLNMTPESCNFLDMTMKILMDNNYDIDLAFARCGVQLTRESLREPTLTPTEIKNFENAVAEHGSELHPVSKCVATQPMSMIVRYYYYWKKTPNGRRIWGNFKGRSKNKGKGKSEHRDSNNIVKKKATRERKPTKLLLDEQTDKSQQDFKFVDDSSFDTENMQILKTYFQCMFCRIDYSPMWYRITGGSDDDHIRTRMQTGVNEKTESSDKLPHQSVNGNSDKKSTHKEERLDALCIRCARIWRRYGVRWQPPLDILKRLNGGSTQSLHALLEAILEGNNINALSIDPQLAHNKFLEWELVQDAELITRQRLIIMNDPERLVKMRRNSMASRAQLYKMVKRPFDKESSSNSRMQADLEGYVAKMKRKKLKKNPSELKTSDNMKSAIQQTAMKDKKSTELNQMNISKKVNATSMLLANNYQQDLAPNGDLKIKIPLEGHKFGEITIDTDFEYIQLSEEIYKKLMKPFQLRRRTIMQSNNDGSEPVSKKLKKIEKGGCQTHGDFVEKQRFYNKTNIPIVINKHDSTAFIRAYHEFNPFRPSSAILQSESLGNEINLCSKKNSLNGSKSCNLDGNSISVKGDVQVKNHCCVCREKFDDLLDEQIVCHSCGVSVHHYCYGVQIPKNIFRNRRLKEYKWLCNPCSNDLNPIASTNYQCSLCYPKKAEYNAPKNQCSTACRDALKCTTEGSWVHIICALFNESIMFGSGILLQPVINTKAIITGNIGQLCGICNLTGGGLVKCDLCSKKFHVTCAQETSEYLLRLKEVNLMNLTTEKPTVIINNNRCILSAALICKDHPNAFKKSENKYIPLNQKTNDSIPYVEIFSGCYKDNSCRSIVRARYLEQQASMNGECPLKQDELSIARINSNDDNHKSSYGTVTSSNAIEKERKKCNLCGAETSIYWYENNVCHSCHISRISETSAANEGECSMSEDSFTTAVEPCISLSDATLLLEGINPDVFEMELLNDNQEKKRKKTSQPTIDL